jgi:hypothetical protein
VRRGGLWAKNWEPIGNFKGTYWEHKKIEKNPPAPHPKLKRKKINTI